MATQDLIEVVGHEHIPVDGKRALITGAASGIGRSIAFEFAQAGTEVLLLGLQLGSPIGGRTDSWLDWCELQRDSMRCSR